MSFIDALADVEVRHGEITTLLADPDVASDRQRFIKLSQEFSELDGIVQAYRQWRDLDEDIKGHEELLEAGDDELAELAREELPELESQREELEHAIKLMLLPKDAMDARNVILEIRAGTGGDEAALFAADLFRMYSRYAETMGWRLEILSANETDIGGFKEVVAAIEGTDVFSRMKYEGGVHRVQRIPTTESGGRIHTSAVTVAVLPEAEELDIHVPENELRIDVYRSSGPGGQSVNTTDSAVRILHVPTGIKVTCQDEKSQHKNKARAMKILMARILEVEEEKRRKERDESRKSMVGSGDRSERVRTYNFPQNRLSDHRIGLTLYKLDQIMEGAMGEVVEALITHFQAEALKRSGF